IGEPIVDDGGTCGNLMAAVGAFIINEQLVSVDVLSELVTINVINTNINKEIKIKVPLEKGVAKVMSNYLMPGLVTTGAKYHVKIMDPGRTKTEKTLPLGLTHTINVNEHPYNVSFVDIVNPFVFISALELNLTGTEMASDLANNKE